MTAAKMTWTEYIPYASGYIYAIIVGHYLVKWNVDALWDVIAVGPKTLRRYPWPSALLGHLERTMYTTALLLQQEQVIAVWLALKAVPQWRRWSDEIQTGHGPVEGRAVFNVFLIGNALNVFFAFIGARIVLWARAGEIIIPIVEGAALVMATVVFLFISRRNEFGKQK